MDATGYFCSDYFTVDPKFGTLEQARTLVDEAHARGLYVFFDGVFGHHKSNVVASPGELLPSGGENPVSYPGSLPFYTELAKYWVRELKIDGWRLDQAYQVPVGYWDDLRSAVAQASEEVTYVDGDGETVHPLGYMVAEVWSGEGQISSAAYGSNASPALASAFDFPTRYRLVQVLAAQEDIEASYAKNGPASRLNEAFGTFGAYPDHAMPNLMLGNHDLVRFGDLVERAGYAGPGSASYWSRHKAAFAFQAAYSGPITVYYGDEVGDEVPAFDQPVSDCGTQGLCDDHVARTSGIVRGVATRYGGTPTVLNANQADLVDYVSSLMALRAAHPALSHGSRTHVYSDVNVYLDRKEAGSDRILFALNVKDQAAVITLAASTVGGATQLTDLLSAETLPASGGQFTLELAPLSGRFLAY
ncbi:MAG: alpha-amylase family glycosyl hydrolase [Anaeromyxobacter sp.]